MAGVTVGDAAAARWQVTLCDPIWHAGSRSSGMLPSTNCYSALPLPFFTFIVDQIWLESRMLCLSYSTMFQLVSKSQFRALLVMEAACRYTMARNEFLLVF